MKCVIRELLLTLFFLKTSQNHITEWDQKTGKPVKLLEKGLVTILACLLEYKWPEVTLQNNFLAFTHKSGKHLSPFSLLSWLATKVSIPKQLETARFSPSDK